MKTGVINQPFKEIILNIQRLKTYFFLREGVIKALDGIDFSLGKREVLGIVGESGCGKSVLALSILRLVPVPPGKFVDGEIFLNGRDLLAIRNREMRNIRGKEVSMVFQEPLTSLNPVYTIGKQIAEVFRIQQGCSRKEAWNRAIETLRMVKIPDPEKRSFEYPHKLSGGMRQRVMIAMALSCQPSLMIADEPTTALDVTIQAQILDLFLDLRKDFESSILFITHDLGIVAEIADRILVMYAGKVVEEADSEALFNGPFHPYTKGLMKAVPKFGQRAIRARGKLEEIPGSVPRLLDLPTGCSFHPRCAEAKRICREEPPEIQTLSNGRRVRCWLYDGQKE